LKRFSRWCRLFGVPRLLLCLIAVALVAWMEATVVHQKRPALDIAILDWLALVIPAQLGSLLVMIYKLSGTRFTAVLVAAALRFLYTKRAWNDLRWLAVGTAGILLIIDRWLKPYFDRSRPPERLVEVIGRSFPSGHAAGAVVFYFLMCMILTSLYPRLRRPLYLGASLWVALVWLSTLYCRVHWPTDMVAGACVGFIWFSLCAVGLKFCAPRQTAPSLERTP
jgi:membrane-associated phospholipid phosphatase